MGFYPLGHLLTYGEISSGFNIAFCDIKTSKITARPYGTLA